MPKSDSTLVLVPRRVKGGSAGVNAKQRCPLLPGAWKSACHSARAGEAETGNAGERPDGGIAGRNSSADDELERDPRGTLCSPGPGLNALERATDKARRSARLAETLPQS